MTAVVPFLLEDRLKERGGLYSKGADGRPYVQVEGKLVTGQNPASSRPAPVGAFTGDALFIDGDGFTLLNVRGKEEFESGHLRKAAHVYIGDLPSKLEQIPRRRPITTF